jgi:MerR family gold-responsive transcriptional activator of gol and ges genes
MVGSFIIALGTGVYLNIGELAKSSGVNAKLIRHYESIGLIPKAARTDSGYRFYKDSDIQFLRFIKRARGLGFSMKEIKALLGLWRNKARKSYDVKFLAQKHIKELETKILEMQEMVDNLRSLYKGCHGDSRPECPILNALEGDQ